MARKRIAKIDRIISLYMEIHNCDRKEAWRRHKMNHSLKQLEYHGE